MIIFYLGQCSNLLFLIKDHVHLPEEESAYGCNFNPKYFYKMLVERLTFFLKHLTKLSMDETNV